MTFHQYLRTIDTLKSFKINEIDSEVIFATHITSGISCNIICKDPYDELLLKPATTDPRKFTFVLLLTSVFSLIYKIYRIEDGCVHHSLARKLLEGETYNAEYYKTHFVLLASR